MSKQDQEYSEPSNWEKSIHREENTEKRLWSACFDKHLKNDVSM